MITTIVKKLKSFQVGENGTVLVFVGLILMPMLLILGLAVDSSHGLVEKQRLQMACDAAAKAGSANGKGVAATITSQAQSVFTANTAHMTNITGPTITVNTSAKTVTVSASIVVANPFMTLGGIPTTTYSVSSTWSLNTPTANNGCIYSLDPSASGAINLNNGSQVKITGCGVYANSSSTTAVEVSGGSNLTASFLNVVGNYSVSGGSSVTTTQAPTTGASAVSNPIGTLTIPSYSSCTHNNFYASTTQTINPGVYCNGISVGGGVTLTLNPGQYIIDGGTLAPGGGATIKGSNVTIILTKQLSSSYASINISNGATAILSAPTGNTSNPFNGIVIYQNPNAPSGVTNVITGGSNLSISGIVYLPTQIINFSGGSTTNAACTILIAYDLILPQGITVNCPSTVLPNYMYSR
jgi:Flp pilus assembly protein TadG